MEEKRKEPGARCGINGEREKQGQQRTRKVIPKGVTNNYPVGNELCHTSLGYIEGEGFIYGKL